MGPGSRLRVGFVEGKPETLMIDGGSVMIFDALEEQDAPGPNTFDSEADRKMMASAAASLPV